jgi:predicted transport protein
MQKLSLRRLPPTWKGDVDLFGAGTRMSDIKLFHMKTNEIEELAGQSVQIEKSLQTLFENNLEALLGISFIVSEHSTGPVHGGRIDTLGLDEDGCPVIIEYKRAVNENVVNQGLYYLDWLMDHKRDFEWLVLKKLGQKVAEEVDWSSPRLLCIAGDFTKYDEHAVKQMNRNIELLRYRRFGSELLMIELLHAPKVTKAQTAVVAAPTGPTEHSSEKYTSQRITYRIANAPKDIRDVYEAVVAFLTGLGDDVQVKELMNYIAFKRIKNFACVEVYPQAKVVTAYLKIDPAKVAIEENFTRDVRRIGHFGTRDLEVSMKNLDDFAKAQPLLTRAYEGG